MGAGTWPAACPRHAAAGWRARASMGANGSSLSEIGGYRLASRQPSLPLKLRPGSTQNGDGADHQQPERKHAQTRYCLQSQSRQQEPLSSQHHEQQQHRYDIDHPRDRRCRVCKSAESVGNGGDGKCEDKRLSRKTRRRGRRSRRLRRLSAGSSQWRIRGSQRMVLPGAQAAGLNMWVAPSESQTLQRSPGVGCGGCNDRAAALLRRHSSLESSR